MCIKLGSSDQTNLGTGSCLGLI